MDSFFKKILDNLKNISSKLNQTQKLIIIGVGALIIVGFFFLKGCVVQYRSNNKHLDISDLCAFNFHVLFCRGRS